MMTKPDITEGQYNNLVEWSDQLLEDVGCNEKHVLSELLNSIGNLIFRYETYHFGDVSISIKYLDIDFDAIYDYTIDGEIGDDVGKISGIVTHGGEELIFYGFYCFSNDFIQFSDPIRENVWFTSFTAYKEFQEEYDNRFFSVFLAHLFRTRRCSYHHKLTDDYETKVDKYVIQGGI